MQLVIDIKDAQIDAAPIATFQGVELEPVRLSTIVEDDALIFVHVEGFPNFQRPDHLWAVWSSNMELKDGRPSESQ